MEIATAKSKIAETFAAVTELSATQQKNIIEEKVNNFLDKIGTFNNQIQFKIEKLDSIGSKLEELSHFDDLNEEDLNIIKAIIEVCRLTHRKLIRYYADNSWTISKGYSTKVMRSFKVALDNLKEHCEDLENLFFVLPFDEEMNRLADELGEASKKLNC